ncbi:hypothetical protein CMI37_07045 [Candidatus Pacearchaeota archaeon]|nr:hypothetical protein [Candidatus Pacearchaeota archaeon]|tara:strand:+ start:364 stop:765 length:402 start_codon:yes stop_codon:yes gene_type:complete
MSTPFNPTLVVTRKCNADLSSSDWLLVSCVGDDDIEVAGTTSTATGDLCIGALTNDVADGSSTEVYVPVQMGGMIKVLVGTGGITAGDLAMADDDGTAIDVATGKYAFGIALETHAAGDVGAFLFAPSYYEEG